MFSQIQSFEADLLVPELAATEGGPATFRGVFIRAPAILETGPDVQVLADYAVPPGKSVTLGSDVESQAVYHSLSFSPYLFQITNEFFRQLGNLWGPFGSIT